MPRVSSGAKESIALKNSAAIQSAMAELVAFGIWRVEAIFFIDTDATYAYIWVNYNDLTVTSLESWLVREIIPKWP